MAKYLAISIGPIFETLRPARSTKALWASSYVFSWIMREMLKKLLNDVEEEKLEIIDLTMENKIAFQEHQGVGLFPDRFVARILKSDYSDMQKVAREVMDDLAKMITKNLNDDKIGRAHVEKKRPVHSGNVEKGAVLNFLFQYFRILSVEMELPEKESNPVKLLTDHLNSLELAATRPPKEAFDILGSFFENLFYNDLIKKGFNKDRFPSSPAIATSMFKHTMEKAYNACLKTLDDRSTPEALRQQEFMNALEIEAKDSFKLCHKYVAIVRADADNMGHLFQSRDVAGKQTLANCLVEFSLMAATEVELYGGITTYAGGDDLLFMAPAVSLRKTKKGDYVPDHIFLLMERLDEKFKELVLDEAGITNEDLDKLAKEKKSPSMSYGVSICHYKYPMGESLEIAHSNLFTKIKSPKTKNAIAWNLTKHSGSGFGVTLQKHTSVFAAFQKLQLNNVPDKENPGKFLSSVIFKLEDLNGLFLGTAGLANRDVHFHSILYNNFNEKIHRDPKDEQKLSPYLRDVLALITAVFDEHPLPSKKEAEQTKQQIKENLLTVYSCLRFIHFLNSPSKS
ncbi:MAG: hypothetical protein KDC86_16995 [Saprospiraceae bacterium]|nr:hypothetical protein [Saprospiraceae bacterium]